MNLITKIQIIIKVFECVCLLNACMRNVHMTCPPPPTQRNHKGWRSAPDAILPGHRRHPSGSRQGHPRYTGAVTMGGRGWPDTNDTNVKSTRNDASSKHSKNTSRQTNSFKVNIFVARKILKKKSKINSFGI